MVALAVVMLGVCLAPPLFETPDPTICTAAFTQAGAQECVCSECVEWDSEPRATRYEVTRTTVSNGNAILAGIVYPQVYQDEDGATVQTLPTIWCFAMDSSFPRNGTRYRYTVRACNAYGCSVESVPVFYVGAPYACYQYGAEVPCYVGDSVARP